MKIRPVGAEMSHADGRTGMTKPTVAFRNLVKVPKNCSSFFFSLTLNITSHIFIHLFRNIRFKLLVNGNGPIQTKIKFTPQVSVYVITSNLFKILYHLNTKNKTTRPPHQIFIRGTSPKEKHKPITLRKIILTVAIWRHIKRPAQK